MISFFRKILLASLVGIASGSAASIFLILLDQATHYREAHAFLIGGLPIAGLLMGWVFFRFGKGSEKGSNLVIDQLERELSPEFPRIPGRMAPLVLGGTLLTHFFGGSAGREGTAVQMGAALADQITSFFKITQAERRNLLIAGAGSGFGAAIGAPWAGFIFGMEMRHIGPLKLQGGVESFIASWVAYATTHFLQAPHSVYLIPQIPPVTFWGLLASAGSGVVFGLLANFFSKATHSLEHFWEVKRVSPKFRPFWGGCVLVLLCLSEGSYRYNGLGISVIQDALSSVAQGKDVFWKFLFTVITVGSGFKGGEFIPLVFMGTCLGSALSQWPFFSHLSLPVLGSLGFAAVFGAASNTPLACFIMSLELFGFALWPYALLSCFFAYWASGHRGIYSAQRLKRHKLSFLNRLRKPF